ncbi:hypothetical protein M9458_016890, partial [Cirrhinus mrigala]
LQLFMPVFVPVRLDTRCVFCCLSVRRWLLLLVSLSSVSAAFADASPYGAGLSVSILGDISSSSAASSLQSCR